MADTDRNRISEFNAEVIAEFRANEGRLSGVLADNPIPLLHHIGAKSRTKRVTPLGYKPRSTSVKSISRATPTCLRCAASMTRR